MLSTPHLLPTEIRASSLETELRVCWKKPVEKNSSGYVTVHLQDEFGPQLENGIYTVLWPDLHAETEVEIKKFPHFEDVHDHGHTRRVKSMLPNIVFTYHGSVVKLPIVESGVKIGIPSATSGVIVIPGEKS